jgi:hypothetical protein
MGLDIRLPIGGMFAILGGCLALYGLATGEDPMYRERSLGLNVNLWWGLCMLVFGVVMVVLGRRAASSRGKGRPEPREERPRAASPAGGSLDHER